MLTTEMDSFVFVSGPGPLPPDCPGPTDYCSHQRTTVDGAYLGGVLQVQDSPGLHGVMDSTAQVAGMLTQRSCDTVDYDWNTGCLHVSDPVTASYIGDITGTPDSTTTQSLEVDIKRTIPGTTAGATMVSLGATYAGDSIYGRFFWGELGHYPHYVGSFVLRRVK